ncbi:hypothetical protein HUU39_10490 [candidate division KSB1 bacterium]|nr:hypothetical protein [bacterium]NUM65686.1 hypothetical protein [candidate division KSB1 bacterium]
MKTNAQLSGGIEMRRLRLPGRGIVYDAAFLRRHSVLRDHARLHETRNVGDAMHSMAQEQLQQHQFEAFMRP